MESNDLPLRVVPLGFEEDMAEKLEKIFQRERAGQRAYTTIYPYTGEAVDIFLINYENPTLLAEKNSIVAQCSSAAIVAASQHAITDESVTYTLYPYQVHGILLAARLLGVLDKVGVASDTPVVVHTEPAVDSSADAYKALVVDDSVAIQKSLEINLRTLKNIGQIEFADSGEQALEKLDAMQYDIIFLDVMMPGIDGYETCTQIRKKTGYKHTPIIMVSGKTSPLDEVKGIIAGCTTYLTKPVQDDAFQKLGQRMMEWLAQKKV